MRYTLFWRTTSSVNGKFNTRVLGEPHRFPVTRPDGSTYDITASIFRPPTSFSDSSPPQPGSSGGPTPRGAVILLPGTAMPRTFYEPMMTALAQRGYAGMTYNPEGVGDAGMSSREELPHCQASVVTWAGRDTPAAMAELFRLFPDVPKYHIVAHSAGVQYLGLCPEESLARFSSQVTIAGTTGYIPFLKWDEQLKFHVVYWLLAPLVLLYFKYANTEAVGLGASIPARASLQLRRFMYKGRFLRAAVDDVVQTSSPKLAAKLYTEEERAILSRHCYDRLSSLSTRSLAAVDDPVSPPKCVRQSAENYPKLVGETEFIFIDPKQYKMGRIGHLRYFREKFGDSIWPLVFDFLDRH